MRTWEYKPARDLGLAGNQRWTSVRRESGLDDWLIQSIWWNAARLGLGLMHRPRVSGLGHLPAHPPFVLVANHTSHLDALVVVASLPRRLRRVTLALAADDTFFDSRPRAAFAAMCLNALPLRRHRMGRHSLDELRDRLVGEPCGYLLFPEGTRSRSGAMNPFKPGLGMLIAGTDVPVIPCRIIGAFEAWPPHATQPRPHPIRVHFGPALRFNDVANTRSGWEQVAVACERAVRDLTT